MQSTGHFNLKSWTIYNSVGWVIGMIIMLMLALLGDLFNTSGFKGSQCIVGIGLGCGMGFMQWQYLKKNYDYPGSWFWFSFIGMGFVYILYDVICQFIALKPEFYLPFFTFFGAGLSSYLQAHFVLKSRFKKPMLWFYINPFIWLFVHLFTGLLFLFNLREQTWLPKPFIVLLAFTFLFIGGPLIGLFTGFFFKRAKSL